MFVVDNNNCNNHRHHRHYHYMSSACGYCAYILFVCGRRRAIDGREREQNELYIIKYLLSDTTDSIGTAFDPETVVGEREWSEWTKNKKAIVLR